MGIFGAQIQPNTITPGQVAPGSFQPSTGIEQIAAARLLTVDDNGKTFHVLPTHAIFDLPAWADVPDGFCVRMFDSRPLKGSNNYWPFMSQIGYRPVPADSICFAGGYNSGMGRPGQAAFNGRTGTISAILKTNIPNVWLMQCETSYYNGFAASGQAKAAVLDFVYGNFYRSSPNYLISGGIYACDDTGDPNPLEMTFGTFNTYGNFSPFDGVSGGPQYPFFVELTNSGTQDYYGSWINIYFQQPSLPPNGSYVTTDFNWALWDQGDDGPGTLYTNFREGGGPVDPGLVIPPGGTVSFYLSNASQSDGYTALQDTDTGLLYGYNCYLRRAPGEGSYRSWSQAFALGPM